MLSLILATRNEHKVEELAALLGPSFELRSLAEWPDMPELPETGTTLEANSAQKALFVYEQLGLPCLADDSGLEVYALNGEPGVDSAHYAGTRDSAANLSLVLSKLEAANDRRARFRCVLSIIEHGVLRQYEGRCEGHLAHTPAGEGGFGYDPAFVPEGRSLTFSQMPAADKNALSHRARAVEAMLRAYAQS